MLCLSGFELYSRWVPLVLLSGWRRNSNMLWFLWPSRSKRERKGKRRNFEESWEHFYGINTSTECNCTWQTWTKRRIKPQRNQPLNRKTRGYDCLKCNWNIPDIIDKRTLRWPLARQPTCSRKWSFNKKLKPKSNNHGLMTFIVSVR